MPRRIALKPEDTRLLERIRGQQWTVDELRWVLSHLDERAPTLIVQELHAKLVLLSADAQTAIKSPESRRESPPRRSSDSARYC
jgi:hypothetical protein